MSEIVCSVVYLAWVQAAATTTFQADYRSFSWAPTMDFVDCSAGSDTYENLKPSIRRGNEFSVTYLHQTGASGQAYASACARGNLGTFLYGPEGSAVGTLLYSIPAYSMGLGWNEAYADAVEVTANFRQKAAETLGTFAA